MKTERQIIAEVLDRLLEKDDPRAGTGTAVTLILKGLKERRAYVARDRAIRRINLRLERQQDA